MLIEEESTRYNKIYGVHKRKFLLEIPEAFQYWKAITSLTGWRSFSINAGNIRIETGVYNDLGYEQVFQYSIPFHADMFKIDGSVDYEMINMFFKRCMYESFTKAFQKRAFECPSLI